MSIGQTEQTKIWVLARPNRPEYGYWPGQTDQNMGIGQTGQNEIATDQTEGATHIFSRPLWTVAPDPLSATQVGLANTCLGSRTSLWVENVILLVLVGVLILMNQARSSFSLFLRGNRMLKPLLFNHGGIHFF